MAGQFPNEHENYWLTKSGERRLIAWSNSALLDAQGAVEYVVGTGTDVSEQRRAEEALRRAKDDLEAQVAQRTREIRDVNERLILESLHLVHRTAEVSTPTLTLRLRSQNTSGTRRS